MPRILDSLYNFINSIHFVLYNDNIIFFFFYVLNYWQVYDDTVKQMALSQFIVGTPLRTLCLLAAGQPADVFSSATTGSSLPSYVDKTQQPAKVIL